LDDAGTVKLRLGREIDPRDDRHDERTDKGRALREQIADKVRCSPEIEATASAARHRAAGALRE
jgi:hypothetical protein